MKYYLRNYWFLQTHKYTQLLRSLKMHHHVQQFTTMGPVQIPTTWFPATCYNNPIVYVQSPKWFLVVDFITKITYAFLLPSIFSARCHSLSQFKQTR